MISFNYKSFSPIFPLNCIIKLSLSDMCCIQRSEGETNHEISTFGPEKETPCEIVQRAHTLQWIDGRDMVLTHLTWKHGTTSFFESSRQLR